MIRTAKNPANLRGDCCSIFQIVSNTTMPTFSGVQSAVRNRKVSQKSRLSYNKGKRGGAVMRNQHYHIYLTGQERMEIIKALIELKNALYAEGKYTDGVDEVLLKLTSAKRKKIKVV